VAIVLTLFRETRPVATGRQPFAATLRGYGQVLRDRRYLVFCAVTLLPLYGFGTLYSLPQSIASVFIMRSLAG